MPVTEDSNTARPLGLNRTNRSSQRSGMQPSQRQLEEKRSQLLSEEAAHRQAIKNAEFSEWIGVRVLFSRLARKTMSASEVWVRILSILRRNPSLMAEGAKGVQTSGIGGDGGDQSRLSPDLEQAFGSGASGGKGT